MRLIFLGTPDFAVPPLLALSRAGHEIAAVVARPDQPSGRGKKLHPTPVKQAALNLGLPVYEPADINSPEALALLRDLRPDILVVVAYGQFLGEALLALAPYGAVNIHASLLPAYRGAAPIHWAVLNGEKESGVTIMRIDSGMDSGDILLQAVTPIGPEMNTGQLHDVLAQLGAELLPTALRQIETGAARPTPQDHQKATRAPLLQRSHEALDWAKSDSRVHDQIRGLAPWPGAYTLFRGKRLKVLAASLEAATPWLAKDPAPGQVLRADGRGLLVA